MKKKIKHWRRINPYICAGCGLARYSFKWQRALQGLCRSCNRNKVNENQLKLI